MPDKPFTFRLDQTLHRRLKVYCAERGITLQDAITFALINYLGAHALENEGDSDASS
jgi:predicted HicB family RNase H-like nuclease